MSMLLQAASLNNLNRFDVFIKRAYVRSYLRGQVDPFIEDLYIKHILIINGGFENDESKKKGATDFISTFNNLIESILEFGFQGELYIDNDNIILDGAHRLSIAIELNLDINITYNKDVKGNKYSLKFFTNNGLSPTFLGGIVSEYHNLKDYNTCLILWPKSSNKWDDITKNIKNLGDVFYYDLICEGNYSFNIVKKLYWTEKWLGNSENFYFGIRKKSALVGLKKKSKVRIIFTKAKLDRKWKENSRITYSVGQHGFHTSDDKEEFFHMLETFSLSETRRLINSRKNTIDIDYIKNIVSKSNEIINKKEYLIIGGIGAMHGIRKSLDLDLCNKNIKSDDRCKFLGHHKYDMKHYTPIVIYGYNFISVNDYIIAKIKRGSGMDKNDMLILNNKINIVTYRLRYTLRILYRYSKSILKRFLYD